MKENIAIIIAEMRKRFPIIYKASKISIDLGEHADTTVIQTEHTNDKDLEDFILYVLSNK